MGTEIDPVRDLLSVVGVDLVDVVQSGWPIGVAFVPPAGPLFYNVNDMSPEWVNNLMSHGHQGDVVMRAILGLIATDRGEVTPRSVLFSKISKSVQPWFYGAN